MKVLITRKVGMTSTIGDNGELLPVTLLSASPNTITQIKTLETDGHNALQLGFEKTKKLSKPLTGHLKKSGASSKIIREFPINELDPELKPGVEITADTFVVGDIVHVTGTSKGKGFAGTIKRHNFHRGPKTHGGQSYRRPGSIGSMYPQKIFKGKKMAGHMGHSQVTVRNLKVALVDTNDQVIGVIGAVPGPRKSIVIIKGAQ